MPSWAGGNLLRHVAARNDGAQVDVARHRHVAAGLRRLEIGGDVNRPIRQVAGAAGIRPHRDREIPAAAPARLLLLFQRVAKRREPTGFGGIKAIGEDLRIGLELGMQRHNVSRVRDLARSTKSCVSSSPLVSFTPMRKATPAGLSFSTRGSFTAARSCAGSVAARSARASRIIDVTGMWPQPASRNAMASRTRRIMNKNYIHF